MANKKTEPTTPQVKKTILLFTASPWSSDALAVRIEVKRIKQALERSTHRDLWTIESDQCVTPTDFRRALLKYNPAIVHFAGHGAGKEGLVFENEVGDDHLVRGQPLAQMLSKFSSLECVILNACDSIHQVEELQKLIPHVIGMTTTINDEPAIEFSIGFYDALFAGRSYSDAFGFAQTSIDMQNLPDADVPMYLSKDRRYIPNARPRQERKEPNNIPLGGRYFTGRDEFLKQLKSSLASGTKTAITTKQAIHGMGGVGKTRVAIEYAHQNKQDYAAMLFVVADSPENLERNLAELSQVLKLPEREAKEQDVQLNAVLKWLKDQQRWLLILDNVDDDKAATAVEKRIALLKTGHILVTSRMSRGAWLHFGEPVELDVLEKTVAKNFLLDRTTGCRTVTEADETEAAQLAKELGYLPLALEQAGAFIAIHQVSFAEYRAEWQRHNKNVLEWFNERVMNYPSSVATTFLTSFDKLEPESKALLNILCWLAPDPIPVAMVDGLMGESDKFDTKLSLANIAKYSLLKWSDSLHSFFQIHRLIQEMTEYQIPNEDKQPWLKLAIMMLDLFCRGNPEELQTWTSVYNPTSNHVLKVIEYAEKVKVEEHLLALMNNFGLYHKIRGNYYLAESIYIRTLKIKEVKFGPVHAELVPTLNNLAMLLKTTNKFTEAEPMMRRALNISDNIYGPEHIETATSLNNLAQLLQDTNRLNEAESLTRMALKIVVANFGDDHPNVAVVLNNLAQLLQATCRLHEAETTMRRVLSIFERFSGKNHPRVALSLNNLAALLIATKRLTEAEPMLRRSMNIVELSYGPDHQETAICINNLAQLLMNTNRLKDAETLMRRALEIDEANFGPFHSSVARDLNNLAHLLHITNRISDAEQMMRRSLEIDEASFGPDHPNVARDLNNLAQLLKTTNRLAEAESIMRRMVEISARFKKLSGHQHPYMQDGFTNYYSLLKEMGLSDAEASEKIQQLVNAP